MQIRAYLEASMEPFAYFEPPWIRETRAHFPRMYQDLEDYNFVCGDGWKVIVTGLCEEFETVLGPSDCVSV